MSEIHVMQVIPTVQGEGITSGVPSLLVRLGGCNISCPFCDTKWANGFGSHHDSVIVTEENLSEFLDKLRSYDQYEIQNLMITGGEPLLYADSSVFQKLLMFGFNHFENVEIETNGTFIDKLPLSSIDWSSDGHRLQLNISPKLNQKWYQDSSDYDRMVTNCHNLVQEGILENYWFKFVDNGKPATRMNIEQFINEVEPNPTRIGLMPLTPPRPDVGESYMKYLGQYRINCMHTLKYCMERGYRLIPRIHVFLFEDEYEKF